MEETYEAPEVVTYSELDFEPTSANGCVSLFACAASTYQTPF